MEYRTFENKVEEIKSVKILTAYVQEPLTPDEMNILCDEQK